MATTEDLFTGFAGLLQTASVGIYNGDPRVPYADGSTAIVRAKLPAGPDRAVALRLMRTNADVVSPLTTYLMQALTRGLPNDAADASNLTDAVVGALLGLTEVWFGATHVLQVRFAGSVDLDADESERGQWSTKFLVDVDEAPTILRPEGGAWD
ncbi:minor capsid protein [Leifsonia sp. TF02-11]|uniref:minor capsid protein n=1 Tax=Leifsonia sp. TF02-11 TaxID=2815212 RepID=UPI001AA0FA8F|nr:minor capsid protein [Leifsonia sp. TF02-11]MBO1739667.1 hypothetical protein [Leifsonia sp. TF02-11]